MHQGSEVNTILMYSTCGRTDNKENFDFDVDFEQYNYMQIWCFSPDIVTFTLMSEFKTL